MWRLLYYNQKLSPNSRRALQCALEDVTYTCGALLQDMQVFVRQIRCHDIVEKLYYSVGKPQPVCMHCCAEDSLTVTPDFYPQRVDCAAAGKEPIKKRK